MYHRHRILAELVLFSNFAGTEKFVGKLLVGMVPYVFLVFVQDWHCLIGS